MLSELAQKKTVVIAEIGVNHNGQEALAFELVEKAKQAGADVVKFQTFHADQLATDSADTADYQKKTESKNQRQLLQQLQLSNDAFARLKKHCEQLGVIFLSSPFDDQALMDLNALGVEAFKVGSGEITNFPFLEKIVATGKPLLLSTGMADLDEIRRSFNFVKNKGCRDLVLFHCVSDYPTQVSDLNLNFITTLHEAFNVPIGLSDHSLSTLVPAAAVALGVKYIEKHFTLNPMMPGPDHAASLDPKRFAEMVQNVREVEAALGSKQKKLTATEMKTKDLVRKSLVFNGPLKKGTRIEKEHLAAKRPALGLPPSAMDSVVGKCLRKDVKTDDRVALKDLE